jgi:hypothetical protein
VVGEIAMGVVLAVWAGIHAAGLVILLLLLRDSRAMAAQAARWTRQVEGWLDAQDEATRERHAAILREFGLD